MSKVLALGSIVFQRWLPIFGEEYFGQESLVGFSELLFGIQDCLRSRLLALDIGCGRGAIACRLVEIVPVSIIGIDSNSNSIEVGRKLASQHGLNPFISFSVADMDTFTLEAVKGKIDLVYSLDALQYSFNLSQCLQNIATHLKPSGYLYATIWCFDDCLRQLALDWGFPKTYSIAQLQKACGLANFIILKFQDVSEIFANRCRASLVSLQVLEPILRRKIGDQNYEKRLSLERHTVEAAKSGFLRHLHIKLKLL